MNLLTGVAWIKALLGWRVPRPEGPDPADMGTAFGLDSITVIDFELSTSFSSEAAAPDWQRRLTRRSRL